MLNEFKLLFLQHRGGAASRTDRLLIDAAAAAAAAESSPPLSPSSPSRASMSLTSSPSLHLGSASTPLASAPLLHSSASSVPALRSSTSPRARHSVAVTSLPPDDGGANADVSLTRPVQSRSAEVAVVSGRTNSKNGRLHTSDETSLVSGSSVDKNSPRDSPASGGESVVESDELAVTAKESGRRRGRASMHVRSDSVGAILSIPQRPGRRTPRLRFLDVPLELLAEEMAAHEIRLMHAVGPREFLNQGWQKNADLNLAPNITAIIDRFNQVSYWTTTEVLTKDTPQLMAKTIKRFIKLAWIFYEMNNFNSLMEIVSGLNSAAVQRLSVWKEVPEKYARRFREMDALMEMKQNYRSYRERLAELLPFLLTSPASPAASASSPLTSLHSSHSLPTSLSLSIAAVSASASGAAASAQQPPASPSSSASSKKAGKVVPYFAVFLRDVTFAMVGNPLYLPPAQKPPTTKAKPTTASPARPRRRLSESDAENAKNVEENENKNENESEDEEGEEEMQRGRETPIEGGAINMDRVQLMYDQVQTFQLLRHEMRGYEFLERQKREKEDKEFLRRLIREYQADLRAITNADLLYDLSLAAEGNALPANALSTSPGPRSPARQSVMAPAAPPPPPSSRNSLSSSSSTTATRQTLPSLVSAFGSIASSSSAVVSRDSSRTHRLSVSNSLSPPLSPASSSPIASAAAAFSRSSSGSIRLRSASDDAGMAASGSSVDVDTGDDTEDDDVDLDYGDVEPEAAAKQRQSPKPTTRRKSRLRRKDVQSMRRVASSPDNNNGGGDEATTTKAAAKRPTASSSSRSAFGLRRSSEPSAAEAELSSTSSSSDSSPSTTANGDLFTSSSTLSLAHLLHASSSSSSPSSSSTLSTSPPSSSSLSTSKGSRREFTFHKGKANISDGDLVSKVAVEVRSFVGNVSRPLLLTFRDTFDDFLGKAGLRHENSPVVSFLYEAPRSSPPSGESTTTPTPAAATTAVVKGEKLVVEDDEGFDAFKRWALRQSERATIDVWLFVGVY